MSLAIIFRSLGPYHLARLEAAARTIKGLTCIELSAVDEIYAWELHNKDSSFRRITLFNDKDANSKRSSEIWKKVYDALNDVNPDAVAVPGWSRPGALAGACWARERGRPAILMSDSTAHDIRRHWLHETIKRYLVHQFSTALVGGSPHAEYLISLGMSSARIFFGFDVVDNSYFHLGANKVLQNANYYRRKYALPKRYFLASNRFVEKKNIFRLLRAFVEYRKSVGSSSWDLVLLGDGPLRNKIETYLKMEKIERNVILPGFVQYRELPFYYGLAGAFVHASISEQWGLVVNEAMSSGLPVIISQRCGCAEDLVDNGRNGFTFDPFNVYELTSLMKKISNSGCDRKKMGLYSYKIISEWTTATFADGLNSSLELALSGKCSRVSVSSRALLWLSARRNIRGSIDAGEFK